MFNRGGDLWLALWATAWSPRSHLGLEKRAVVVLKLAPGSYFSERNVRCVGVNMCSPRARGVRLQPGPLRAIICARRGHFGLEKRAVVVHELDPGAADGERSALACKV